MATYAELSPTDRAIVDNTVNLIRGAVGEVFQSFNRIAAIAADTNAVALVSSIDAAGVIPNTSGLAGADDLTRQEIVTVYNLINGMRTANDTAQNRANASKACGINAMLG